ncbi:MAG TPA: phosphatidylserine/phosphatidylglycerophosphate/cardiolipin synthase family protein, partial [Planctomycetota bacterium]|nr:phosphatidylserine/phosphatidylglycerophosphate/cardiolipin synthase family protein [Planctomycetota bacterium]
RLIENAKESICLQTFIFNDDETGWATAKMLAAAADRGVKVRVIYDAVGSNRAEDTVFEFMKQHRVEVRPYGDPLTHLFSLNSRWHEKHLIVDGQTSIEGGMNIADEYAFGGSGRLALMRPKESQNPWRDTDMEITGPTVADTQNDFFKNWATLGAPVPRAEAQRLLQKANSAQTPGGPSVRLVQHRPDQDHDAHVEKLYLDAINSATTSITIENAYFNPPEPLRDALEAAARRGVDVRVMTNSEATNDTHAVSEAAHYYYPELLASGIKIFERQTSTLHAKTATFDGKFSIVGSANLNGRSDGLDSEAVLATDDPATAKALEGRFAQGVPETKPFTADDFKNESFWTHVKEWGLHLLSWTF